MTRGVYPAMKSELTARWKKEWNGAHVRALRKGFDATLAATDALQDKSDELRSGGKLSPLGLEDELKAFAQTVAVPAFWKASLAIEAAKTDLVHLRKDVGIPKPKENDVASVLLRGEMRSFLRSMPAPQVIQVLTSADPDERLLEAAFEVPPQMIGLTQQMRDAVHKSLIERKHGAEITALDQLEEAVTLINSALEIGLHQLRDCLGFGGNKYAQFDSWMKAATKSAEAADRNARAAETSEQMIARIDREFAEDIDEIVARIMATPAN